MKDIDTNDLNPYGDEVEKRMDELLRLNQEADAVRQKLIDDLLAQREMIISQISELNSDRQDIESKLASLRGEEDPNEKRAHVPDEAILAFVRSHETCTTGEVQSHFEFSSSTVCRRLQALLKANKVTMERRQTTKFWKACPESNIQNKQSV